jgi:hypothetical protein
MLKNIIFSHPPAVEALWAMNSDEWVKLFPKHANFLGQGTCICIKWGDKAKILISSLPALPASFEAFLYSQNIELVRKWKFHTFGPITSLYMYLSTLSQKSSLLGWELGSLVGIHGSRSLNCWSMRKYDISLHSFLSLISHELARII